MGQRRVAGAQDDILAKVGVELLLQSSLYVDLSEDSEPFAFQCGCHFLYGLLIA